MFGKFFGGCAGMVGSLCLSMIMASGAFAAPDPNFHIYIAYGQSNMGGTAEANDADKVENPRFKIFASQVCNGKGRATIGEVYPAIPSLFNCGNTISVADWFGRTMADSMPDVTIGIIPVAVGGASIKLFDKDQYSTYLSSGEAADWLRNYAYEYEPSGNLPQFIVDLAKKAQQVGVIKGIIFHQGETDGGYADWPRIVKKTRDDFLSALSMSSDTVPFVAGELLREGCCYSDRVSKLPETMDNTYFASSEGLSGNGMDRYHFGHDAYVTIGKRYAAEMLKAVHRGSADTASELPADTVVLDTAVVDSSNAGAVGGDTLVAGDSSANNHAVDVGMADSSANAANAGNADGSAQGVGTGADSSGMGSAGGDKVVARLKIGRSADVYKVYDAIGNYIGKIEGRNSVELTQNIAKIARSGGIFYAKSVSNVSSFRISVKK